MQQINVGFKANATSLRRKYDWSTKNRILSCHSQLTNLRVSVLELARQLQIKLLVASPQFFQKSLISCLLTKKFISAKTDNIYVPEFKSQRSWMQPTNTFQWRSIYQTYLARSICLTCLLVDICVGLAVDIFVLIMQSIVSISLPLIFVSVVCTIIRNALLPSRFWRCDSVRDFYFSARLFCFI